MYDPKALELGIVKCKENIKVFEEAIEKERTTITEYRDMIDAIERRERNKERALKNVNVEVDDGG